MAETEPGSTDNPFRIPDMSEVRGMRGPDRPQIVWKNGFYCVATREVALRGGRTQSVTSYSKVDQELSPEEIYSMRTDFRSILSSAEIAEGDRDAEIALSKQNWVTYGMSKEIVNAVCGEEAYKKSGDSIREAFAWVLTVQKLQDDKEVTGEDLAEMIGELYTYSDTQNLTEAQVAAIHAEIQKLWHS